jgi:hypothetical protein
MVNLDRLRRALTYRGVLRAYGGLHIVAGIVLAITPDLILSRIFLEMVPAGAALTIALFNLLTGLGWTGASLLNDTPAQLLVIRLAVLGHAANIALHLMNSYRGESPPYMVTVALIAGGGMMAGFLYLERRLASEMKPL